MTTMAEEATAKVTGAALSVTEAAAKASAVKATAEEAMDTGAVGMAVMVVPATASMGAEAEMLVVSLVTEVTVAEAATAEAEDVAMPKANAARNLGAVLMAMAVPATASMGAKAEMPAVPLRQEMTAAEAVAAEGEKAVVAMPLVANTARNSEMVGMGMVGMAVVVKAEPGNTAVERSQAVAVARARKAAEALTEPISELRSAAAVARVERWG